MAGVFGMGDTGGNIGGVGNPGAAHLKGSYFPDLV